MVRHDLIKEAVADHRHGRLVEAEQKFLQVLDTAPDHAVTHYMLGLIAMQTKNVDAAYERFARAVEIDPSVPEFHNQLGEAHLTRGDVSAAVRCFGKALQLRPYFSAARINIERASILSPGPSRWTRQVMYAEARRLIAEVDPARLDVLEISGTSWREAFPFRSYRSVDYPGYDVCKEPMSERFDLVILEHVLEHVRYPQRALANVRGSLRPGGYCFISTPFLVRIHAIPLDLWRWTEPGLRCVLEDSGFERARIKSGAWGNRDCAIANFTRWEVYDPGRHSLENEPDFPVMVWALAQL